MKTKIVIRILNQTDEMLGWAEVEGHARGDGRIWVNDPTIVMIDVAGTTAFLSVHWCDVNVEIRSAVDPATMKVGDILTLPGNWAAITCGQAAGGLPPVTVRNPVSIAMLPGSLGATSH